MTRRAGMIWTFLLATAWLLLSHPAKAQKFEFAYVANGASDTVSVINTATNKVTATIPVGVFPWAVAITPDGRFAYVADSGPTPGDSNCTPGTVSVIDTATNAVITTVPVGHSPIGVAITSDGASAYVANACSNTISVIGTATNTVTATIDTGSSAALGASRLATTPDGAFAYVTNQISNTVTVININIATNTVATHIAVGGCPYGIAMTPNGAFAYVVNAGPSGEANPGPACAIAGMGSVSIIETATNTVIATVPNLPLGFPNFVGITPDGASAWVTNCGPGACVIDTATNAVTGTFSTHTANTYNLAWLSSQPLPVRHRVSSGRVPTGHQWPRSRRQLRLGRRPHAGVPGYWALYGGCLPEYGCAARGGAQCSVRGRRTVARPCHPRIPTFPCHLHRCRACTRLV